MEKMRIVQLTAGTGSYHCGTCIRDNALVTELRRQGHDALLVPLYLPLTLDEPIATETPLFYGGINVYLQQKLPFFRNSPRWLDHLLDAPKLLMAAGSRAGMTSPRELGELTLSMLRGEEGAQTKELDRLVDWLVSDIRPEVVCLSNVLLIGVARRIREATGAAIACMLQGEDTFLDSLPEPQRTLSWKEISKRAVDVDALLAVSHYYGDLMQDRAHFPAEKMHVVHAGVSLGGYEPAAAPPDPPVLGYLARMCHTKGLSALIDTFIQIRANGRVPNLRLHVVGSQTSEDVRYVAGLQKRLAEKGLSDAVQFFANVERDEKIRLLRGFSVMSVPATYGESFGLYVIEALAAGVPVVQPRHAAFPELIEATGGGVLYEPGNVRAHAAAIESLLLDPAHARELGRNGRRVALQRFGMEQITADTMTIFERLAARRTAAPSLVG
jgi:glycosyltransferase involved in cell wall biosynthesis